MPRVKKDIPRWLTEQELLNPTPDLEYDAVAYGRQSTKKQVVNNIESHKAQTVELLKHMRDKLGYKDDGSTGKVTLRIENQVAGDGKIKNASGAWPIDKRPNLKATLEEVERDEVKLIAVDVIDRLFRDEDQIDSNIFLKACKEHGCYISVVATGMIYNLANNMHMMIVRQLLQIAAHYLKTLKETTGRRRQQARDTGKWAGYGPLKMGYIKDANKGSESYGKLVLYPPHAEVGKWLYKRIIELNFSITELAKEVGQMEYLFEPFLTPEQEGIRKATKLANGGFTLTRYGLRSWLTDETNIGVHYTTDGERVEHNHTALIDEATFNLICTYIKPPREQFGIEHKHHTGRPTSKSLLSHVMTSTVVENPLICVKTSDGQAYSYALYTLGSNNMETITSIRQEVLDNLVTNELFENIKNSDLQLLKDKIKEQEEQRIARLAAIERRLKEIESLQDGVIDEIAEEKAKLKEAGLRTSKYLEAQKAKYDRLTSQAEALEEEQEGLEEKTDTLGTLEDELENLQEMWPDISMGLKKQLIGEVIQNIILTPLSPLFVAVTIKWAYSWSTKTFLIRRRSSSRDWTTEEDINLRRLYPDPEVSKDQLLEALPYRSLRAMHQRCAALGIVHTRSCNTRDLTVLISLSDVKIAEELNVDVAGSTIQEIETKRIEDATIRVKGCIRLGGNIATPGFAWR